MFDGFRCFNSLFPIGLFYERSGLYVVFTYLCYLVCSAMGSMVFGLILVGLLVVVAFKSGFKDLIYFRTVHLQQFSLYTVSAWSVLTRVGTQQVRIYSNSKQYTVSYRI